MTDQTPTNTLTDTEKWQIAHDAICDRSHYCSAHQPDNWPAMVAELINRLSVVTATRDILAAREAHTNTALRAAQAQTLRSAADDYERMYQQPGSATGADWLRRRADRLDAAPAPTEQACSHRFPDGTTCRLSAEAHDLPGMSHHAPAPTDNQHDDELADRVRALADQWETFPCSGPEAVRQLRAALSPAPTNEEP